MREWLNILEICLGVFSLIGSFFILFVFCCYRNLRSFAFEQVAYLTLSTLLGTISYLSFYIDSNNPYDEKKRNR